MDATTHWLRLAFGQAQMFCRPRRSRGCLCPAPVARDGAGDVGIVAALRSERRDAADPRSLELPRLQLFRVLANTGLVRCLSANQRRGEVEMHACRASWGSGVFAAKAFAGTKAGVRLAPTWRSCSTRGAAPAVTRTRSQSQTKQ
jgi:hypothetical protein